MEKTLFIFRKSGESVVHLIGGERLLNAAKQNPKLLEGDVDGALNRLRNATLEHVRGTYLQEEQDASFLLKAPFFRKYVNILRVDHGKDDRIDGHHLVEMLRKHVDISKRPEQEPALTKVDALGITEHPMHKNIFVLHNPISTHTLIVSGEEVLDACKKHREYIFGGEQGEPYEVISRVIDFLESEELDLKNPEHARRAVERLKELNGRSPDARVYHVEQPPKEHYPIELRGGILTSEAGFVGNLRESMGIQKGRIKPPVRRTDDTLAEKIKSLALQRPLDDDRLATIKRVLPKSLVIKSVGGRLHGYHGGTGKRLFVVDSADEKGSVAKVLETLDKHGFASIISDSKHKCTLAAKEKIGIRLNVLDPYEILHLKNNVTSFRSLWEGGARNKSKSLRTRWR